MDMGRLIYSMETPRGSEKEKNLEESDENWYVKHLKNHQYRIINT